MNNAQILHLDHAFKLARVHSNCREQRDGCVITSHNGAVLGTGTTGMTVPHWHDRHFCHCANDYCESSHAATRAVSACGPRINRAEALYCVHAPCPDCINLLTSTPIQEILFAADTPLSPSCMLWERAGRTWTHCPYFQPRLKDIDDA